MKTVGLRELRNRLSEYVRRARDGEEVLVTDRGAVVAELGPPRRAGMSRTAPAGLADFATRGLVTIGASNDAAVYPKQPPALTPGRLTRLLDGERAESDSAACG
jgi:antitoxin (DNA-binding transcriptional repressor) of toxin-antitoxin stability system